MVLLLEDLGSEVTYPVLETPRCGYWGPRFLPSQVTRRSYSGLTGGEIFPMHNHWDGRMD
jgi:hypothetical protein